MPKDRRDKSVAEFGREVDNLQHVDNRHVVKHYGITPIEYNGEKRIAMAMEFCEEGQLNNVTKGKKLKDADVASIMAQITLGLRDAREKGQVVHNDLKPANIFVKDGVIKIGDFGTARTEGEKVLHMNGTPAYAAPESAPLTKENPLFAKNNTYSGKRDIYATGMIGYELATSEPARLLDPRLGNYDLAIAIASDVRPRQIPKDSDLSQTVYYATQGDPQHRSSHLDVLADLSSYPEARKHFSTKDRIEVVHHLVARSREQTRGENSLDQHAALGLLEEDWKKQPGLKLQLQGIADYGSVVNAHRAELRAKEFAPGTMIKPAYDFRGSAISLSIESVSGLHLGHAEGEAQAWRKARDSGTFTAEQHTLITAVKQQAAHLQTDDAKIIANLVQDDWQGVSKMKMGQRGKIAEQYYRAERPDGTYAYGFAKGPKTDFRPEGIWHEFDADNKKTAEVSYRDGLRNGETRHFSKSGHVESRVPYTDGERNGMQSEYHADGRETLTRWEHGIQASQEERSPIVSGSSKVAKGPSR